MKIIKAWQRLIELDAGVAYKHNICLPHILQRAIPFNEQQGFTN